MGINIPSFVNKLTPEEAYCQGLHDGMVEQEALLEAKQRINKILSSTFKFMDAEIQKEKSSESTWDCWVKE